MFGYQELSNAEMDLLEEVEEMDLLEEVAEIDLLKEVFEWEIRNNAGEEFKFFLDEENRPCLNVKFKGNIQASLIMCKTEFEGLIHSLTEMNKSVIK